jgi:hypothetical protein
MSAIEGFPIVEVAALWLILLGSAAEVAAILAAWRTQQLAKVWRDTALAVVAADERNELTSISDGVSEILKALIAKLPWMAVMGLTTIVLGMVLLMGRWPWHAS